ncbi:MAG: hypothetical protein ABIZ49_02420, partial [Opitutaceae bacterium]
MAQLTDRLISTDAVKIQTIELEEERNLAVRTFAEIFAPGIETSLLSIGDNRAKSSRSYAVEGIAGQPVDVPARSAVGIASMTQA